MWVNCMPGIPADPLSGSFTVHYDNSHGTTPAVVTLTTAQWTLPALWTFQVTPNTPIQISAGSSLDVEYKKVPSSSVASDDACSVCNGVGQLTVLLNVDGTLVSQSKTDAPTCSF
jgi:hypothetical protein